LSLDIPTLRLQLALTYDLMGRIKADEAELDKACPGYAATFGEPKDLRMLAARAERIASVILELTRQEDSTPPTTSASPNVVGAARSAPERRLIRA
jgi:hypothetical protein